MRNDRNKTGRREVLKGIGAGLTPLTVSPIFAKSNFESTTQKSFNVNGIEDPAKKYPRPPFKSQSQPWPGLESKMDPHPDHGEKLIKEQVASLAGRH